MQDLQAEYSKRFNYLDIKNPENQQRYIEYQRELFRRASALIAEETGSFLRIDRSVIEVGK